MAVKYDLIKKQGPAGHPLVKFEGTYDELCAMLLHSEYATDWENAWHLMDYAQDTPIDGLMFLVLDVVDGVAGARAMTEAKPKQVER